MSGLPRPHYPWSEGDELFASELNAAIASSGPSSMVNVLSFGAKGDGVTDDTVAIRGAIGTGNRSVYFPPGNYVVSGDPLIIPSLTRLTGAGPNISTIVPHVLNTSFGSVATVFANTALAAFGYPPAPITPPPSPLPDHDIMIDNLGFDMTQVGKLAAADRVKRAAKP